MFLDVGRRVHSIIPTSKFPFWHIVICKTQVRQSLSYVQQVTFLKFDQQTWCRMLKFKISDIRYSRQKGVCNSWVIRRLLEKMLLGKERKLLLIHKVLFRPAFDNYSLYNFTLNKYEAPLKLKIFFLNKPIH